jgi:hypothetical protein
MFGLFCFGELKPVLTYVNYVPFIVRFIQFTYVGDIFFEPKFSLRLALRSAV